MKIDVFNHFMPKPYLERLAALIPGHAAVTAFPRLATLCDVEARLRLLDDHTPFLAAGIPAVDFIDWSYPDGHKVTDTLDKVSQQSLDAVGETVLEYLRGSS